MLLVLLVLLQNPLNSLRFLLLLFFFISLLFITFQKLPFFPQKYAKNCIFISENSACCSSRKICQSSKEHHTAEDLEAAVAASLTLATESTASVHPTIVEILLQQPRMVHHGSQFCPFSTYFALFFHLHNTQN